MLYGFNELIKLSKESAFDPFHREAQGYKIAGGYNQSILIGPVMNAICIDIA